MLKYERKLLKFWIQSFLLGVPKIIVGFRSKDGILQRLEEIQTKDIPGKVSRQGRGTWDGNLCINFTAAFLDCKISHLPVLYYYADGSSGLKQTINSEGAWKIRKREKVPVIEVFRVEETGFGDILTPVFAEWRQSQASESVSAVKDT
jgi:RAT1-interacting protein